jgi:hypothetical protein
VVNGASGSFRRPGFVIAAVVVGVVVLVAVALLGSSLIFGDADDGPPPSASSSSSTPTAGAGEESVCGLDGFETEDTLTEPPDNEWELVGTVAAPVDPQGAGPGRIVDGLRTCFAHTPEGALFMAVNFAAMGTDASLRDRLPELVAPGAGRDVLIQENSESIGSSFRAQIAGFSIGAYSTKEATVDLAVNYASGELVSVPMKLSWVEGDWKVVVTDSGEFPLAPAQISNLGGYIPWSGA